MSKRFFWLIIIAIIFRLILAASSFHPDLRTFQFAGQIVANGNVLNIYDYMTSLPSSNPITEMVVFNYPPAIYLFHGAANFLLAKVLGFTVMNDFLIEKVSDYGNILFNLHLLLLKLPYLPFDIMTAFFLIKIFQTRKEKIAALLIWLFNPVNLHATYMMGQFDIIPTFFTVLSLFLVKVGKLSHGAVALGMGAAFKIYPLFLLIPLVFLGKNWKERMKIFVLGILPYLILTIPYLGSPGFRSTALVANQSLKSLYAEIPISGGERLLLFPLLLVFFYLFFLYRKLKKEDLWQRYLIVLLLFFTFTHFHPQWFLWLTPFLVIDLITSKFRHGVVAAILLAANIILLTFFDPSLTVTLLAPLFTGLYSQPGIWELLKINIDYNMARSVFQTLLAGASVYIIYFYLLKEEKSKIEN
ncbi:DUF2029 domain-containing protein [Candidatus Parcubacteria bacterium]|nr:MAG: DUF2029 domain-containing protein [Candidatus Parcubacteria bacterium]